MEEKENEEEERKQENGARIQNVFCSLKFFEKLLVLSAFINGFVFLFASLKTNSGFNC